MRASCLAVNANARPERLVCGVCRTDGSQGIAVLQLAHPARDHWSEYKTVQDYASNKQQTCNTVGCSSHLGQGTGLEGAPEMTGVNR